MQEAGHAAQATRRRYFPAVEGMRGVAALSVVVGHSIEYMYPTNAFLYAFAGWISGVGLIVFFMISGFLLYRPFIAARSDGETVGSITPGFLARRAVRILPAYWVALIFLSIWPGLTGFYDGPWLPNFALIQIYDISWAGTGIGVAWTLCCEAAFYLALPVFALLLGRRGFGHGRAPRREMRWEFAALGLIGVACLVWRAAFGTDGSTFYLLLNPLGTMIWFCVGMGLAVIEFSPDTLLPRLRRLLANPIIGWTLAIGFLVVLLTKVDLKLGLPLKLAVILQTLEITVIALGVMAPAVMSENGRLVHLVFANRAIVFFGTISYGIYLYHLPIVQNAVTWPLIQDSGKPAVALGVFVLATATILGMASWYLIEKPLMRKVRSVKGFTVLRRGGTPRSMPEPAEEGSGGAVG